VAPDRAYIVCDKRSAELYTASTTPRNFSIMPDSILNITLNINPSDLNELYDSIKMKSQTQASLVKEIIRNSKTYFNWNGHLCTGNFSEGFKISFRDPRDSSIVEWK
ncbi:MAG TPA: hypothetical protein VIM65_04400, partial [Cyclobacteriaceae bacterium]